MATDANKLNIDPTQTVYPIQGSYTVWKCGPSGYLGNQTNRFCFNKTEEPHAEGICYKNSFGDWHCVMTDLKTAKTTNACPGTGGGGQSRIAPPTDK